MDGSSVLESVVAAQADVLSQQSSRQQPELPDVQGTTTQRGRCLLFNAEQKKVLMRYFDEYGMTSTHRRNTELMQKCANEIGSTVDRVKNWIGAEVVKRKRKAGILPRPRVELAGISSQPKLMEPRPKKIKRLNGYNVFFSNFVKGSVGISTDFCERNALVAQKWAELTEEQRKQWGLKAEAICAASIQELTNPQPSSLLTPQRSLPHLLSPSTLTPEINSEEALVEKALLAIQEKFDILEQLGFEGYAILINTGELQTHLLASSKGKSYHKMKQQTGKPLENPFIGFVFSEESEPATGSLVGGGLHTLTGTSPVKRMAGLMSLNSVQQQTMQKSVMNAFALKYKVATGRADVPYDNLQHLGVQVYGMPPDIPFHSPLLYNQQQLQQILANLEKIVFLKVVPPHITTSLHDGTVPLSEVEIATDSVASLVTSNELHIGAEEEATQ